MVAPTLYRTLLLLYPAAFREEYGEEMAFVFREQLQDARRKHVVWLRVARDLLTIAPKEHFNVIAQDVKYALRKMAASPGFTSVAILSLAFGIGANTAIFSLWNRVLNSALPVRAPEELVTLSDPNSSGVGIGSTTGARGLLTYAEFEQLRDHAEVFSGMLASQSSLDRYQIRIDGHQWEEAAGRLVSGEYFQVLGVSPAIGRVFTAADERSGSPFAVISHNYWKRRFGGSSDVIGKSVTVRRASVTIVGVAPAGFFGETVGQQPDIWMPLKLQPAVLPGRDWLHDSGQEKVMWLHAIGRLKPGVTLEHAQSKANAIFHAGLEQFYTTTASAEARKGFLDQRLVLRRASSGASPMRETLGDPLRVLLIAVGVLLLIACANLANLLLARGTARQHEVAVRLSLGASRSRLIRQMLTESLILALAGGLAGLGTAYVFHRALVQLVSQAETDFSVNFGLEPSVLAFCFAATLLAGLAFGALPAWLATRSDQGARLKAQGRTTTGSASQSRWGRALVAVQLALSLPLLMGAGLLIRTLENLQHAQLGYASDHLLVVRVDAQDAGYELKRREPVFEELLEDFRHIPGVKAASFSENGLFSGSDSGDQIEVEGYKRTGKKDGGSRWDQVGPNYFSMLGVPILMGREINARDREGSPKVCVINEAFAKLFFTGRNPLGMHITTVYGDKRNTHEIVGVVSNMRTHSLKRDVDPRYFVPITQPLGEFSAVVFTIRTTGEAGPVLTAIRGAIQRRDGALGILHAQALEERLAARLAQERIMARIAAVFGAVALLLAAIGLYGVLSFSVARRQGEIGIRIALGADPRRVIGMILGETGYVVIAGLLMGGALAFAGGRLMTRQLFGIVPYDPFTFSASVVLLMVVAMAAAYVPARRAARLDPMFALRQE